VICSDVLFWGWAGERKYLCSESRRVGRRGGVWRGRSPRETTGAMLLNSFRMLYGPFIFWGKKVKGGDAANVGWCIQRDDSKSAAFDSM
jgi:hypothetical protein